MRLVAQPGRAAQRPQILRARHRAVRNHRRTAREIEDEGLENEWPPLERSGGREPIRRTGYAMTGASQTQLSAHAAISPHSRMTCGPLSLTLRGSAAIRAIACPAESS